MTSPGPSPLLKERIASTGSNFLGPEGPMFTGRIKRKIEQRKFLSPQGLNERIQPALFARKYRPRRLTLRLRQRFVNRPGVRPRRGGAVAVGSAVHRGGLRRARGESRTSSRVTPRAFSRTKDGSRRCILSRDSNIGTQKQQNPRFRQKPPWSVLWSHRRTRTMNRTPVPLWTGTESDARPPTTRERGRTARRRA